MPKPLTLLYSPGPGKKGKRLGQEMQACSILGGKEPTRRHFVLPSMYKVFSVSPFTRRKGAVLSFGSSA